MRILSASFVLSSIVLFSSPAGAGATCTKSTACVSVSPASAEALTASVTLVAAEGVVSIEEIRAGAPGELLVEWSGSGCGAASLDLYVNDERFPVEPSAAECARPVHRFRVVDDGRIARAWRDGAGNVVRLVSAGDDAALQWARVRAGEGEASPSTCLFDVGGGDCGGTRRPRAGVLRGAFDLRATLASGSAASPRIKVPFAGSELPQTIDISALSDGQHALCVASVEESECVAFDHDGELVLRLEPAGVPNSPPTAIAGSQLPTECTSPEGASVLLDGSLSSDPDGDPITFEWYKDYASPGEVFLGNGAQLLVTLPLGPNAVTLVVRDISGNSGLDTIVKPVVDTTPPTIRVTLNPSYLWPADHQLLAVSASPVALDACGSPGTVLTSIASNEPDDAPGDADGNTTQDIQNALYGTDDRLFSLRAETGSVFGGRRYVVRYTATDASGNKTVGGAAAMVKAPAKPFVVVEDVGEAALRTR